MLKTLGGFLNRREAVSLDKLADVQAALMSEAEPLPVGAHTLIVPTYNRPQELGRLLSYLDIAGLESDILVLDSSADDGFARNRDAIKRSDLTIKHKRYSSKIDPYSKMKNGLKAVKTPFCSACADDDFVLLPGLRASVRELERHDKAAAVHGLYFNFAEPRKRIDVSYAVQRRQQVDGPNALARLRHFMSDYHVLFYAVQRTDVARRSFQSANRFGTTIGREISSSAIVAAHGEVRRIDTPYLGRSTAESLTYHAWHPHQVLCDKPSILFGDYSALRSELASVVAAIDSDPKVAIEEFLDIIFLRYLSQFLRGDVLDFILDERSQKNYDGARTTQRLWERFVRSNRRPHPRVALFPDKGYTFAPGIKHPGSAPLDYLHTAKVKGTRQTMFFYAEFFFGAHSEALCRLSREQTESLMRSIVLYRLASRTR